MRGRRVALGLAVLASLGGCDRVLGKLVVRNESTAKLTDIVVAGRENRSRLGDLDPGEQTTFTGHLKGEGGAMLFYTSRGKRLSYETCYYTGGMPPRGTVVIRDSDATRLCE